MTYRQRYQQQRQQRWLQTRHPIRRLSTGFTAVELLITLFVAAAFLTAGYQLFNVVINDGGDARAVSRAGNVAYDYLRRYSNSATNPCTASIPLVNSALSIDGLNNPLINVVVSCPESDAPTLSRIEVTITYNNPTKTVRYATFVDKSKGATPTVDVTDGLMGRYLFNGNATTDVGAANGTINGATPTTNIYSQANKAYAFVGSSSQNITVPSTFGLGNSNASISFWVYNPSSSSSGSFVRVGLGTDASGYGIGIGSGIYDNSSPGTHIIILFEAIRWIDTNVALGTGWHQLALVLGSDGTPYVYRDGSLVGSYAGASAIAPTNNMTQIGGTLGPSSTSRWSTSSMDDVRFYGRALSGSEVLQLYNGGPK